MQNVDAILRAQSNIGVGTEVSKAFPGHGTYVGKVIGIEADAILSKLYPGETRTAYTIHNCHYSDDDTHGPWQPTIELVEEREKVEKYTGRCQKKRII